MKVNSLSRVRLFETPWTAAHKAPPSMGFSRQEYWSGVPLPSLSNIPTEGLMYANHCDKCLVISSNKILQKSHQ